MQKNEITINHIKADAYKHWAGAGDITIKEAARLTLICR